MTKEQIRTEIDRQLSEYLDGYAMVGVVSGRKEIVVIAHTHNTAETQAIMTGLEGLIADIKNHNIRKN